MMPIFGSLAGSIGSIAAGNTASRRALAQSFEANRGHGTLFQIDHLGAEKVWLFYENKPEFVQAGVVFDQFKARLRDYWKAGKKNANPFSRRTLPF